jgi:hypothetical protein
MCGIVGAVAQRNITPILLKDSSVLNTVVMIPAVLPCMSMDSCSAHAVHPVWLNYRHKSSRVAYPALPVSHIRAGRPTAFRLRLMHIRIFARPDRTRA